MSEEDLERYETDAELALYKEYRDVLALFRYVVETERRFYLANAVNVVEQPGNDRVELVLRDAWVWDIYRAAPARFVASVRVLTSRDVNIEEVRPTDELGLTEGLTAARRPPDPA